MASQHRRYDKESGSGPAVVDGVAWLDVGSQGANVVAVSPRKLR